jgi:sugar phosphate isomerase/epimerase
MRFFLSRLSCWQWQLAGETETRSAPVPRPLLDGTTNWPAVLEAFDQTGYNGYLTFEYFHPYQHFPEALIYQTADSLDRMLGIK